MRTPLANRGSRHWTGQWIRARFPNRVVQQSDGDLVFAEGNPDGSDAWINLPLATD